MVQASCNTPSDLKKMSQPLTSILCSTQVLARKSRLPGPLSPCSMLTVSASSVRLGVYSLRVRQWVWLGAGQGEAGGGAGPQVTSSALVHWAQSRAWPVTRVVMVTATEMRGLPPEMQRALMMQLTTTRPGEKKSNIIFREFYEPWPP